MLGASAIILSTMGKKEPFRKKSEHYASLADLKKVFKVREIKLMFPIWLIIATLLGLAITYLPIILLNQEVKGSTIGVMFGAAGVALGLLQPFWGKVSDMVGRIPVMAYGGFSIFWVGGIRR